MLRALVGRFPLEATRPTVHLEEVVEFSTVAYCIS